MQSFGQRNSSSPVATIKSARPSALRNGLPTLTRLENQAQPHQTGHEGIGRISLMDAIEERFAQIFSNRHEDFSARAVCGDDELMRERENRS